MDLGEGIHLEQTADARVLRTLAVCLEQPSVDVLALLDTGGNRLAKRGLRKLAQVGRHPQLQRVQAGQVAAVGQRPTARAELVAQRLQRPVGQIGVGQAPPDELPEVVQACIGLQTVERGCQPGRRRPRATHEQRFGLVRRLVFVFAIEACDEQASFLVSETRQVFLSLQVRRIVDQRGALARAACHHVAHHVAHQSDEHEVHRARERLAHGHRAAVVRGLEVLEVMQAASGEEALGGARRIAAFHRRVEHRCEAPVADAHEMVARP